MISKSRNEVTVEDDGDCYCDGKLVSVSCGKCAASCQRPSQSLHPPTLTTCCCWPLSSHPALCWRLTSTPRRRYVCHLQSGFHSSIMIRYDDMFSNKNGVQCVWLTGLLPMSVRGRGSIPAGGTRYVAPYKRDYRPGSCTGWFPLGTPVSSTIKIWKIF
jgi:hypothetical protein